MNKTRCPHCNTKFVISDERLSLSQGKVRCGNCLERFDPYDALNKEIPVFDPRSAFIEPLSQLEEERYGVSADDIIPDERSVEFKDKSIEPVRLGKIKKLVPEPVSELEQRSVLISDSTPVPKKVKRDKKSKRRSSKKKPEKIEGDLISADSIDDTKSSKKGLAGNLTPELSVHLFDDDFTEDSTSSEDIDESSHFLEPSTQLPKHIKHVTEASIQYDDNYIEEPSIIHLDLPVEEKPEKKERADPTLNDSNKTEEDSTSVNKKSTDTSISSKKDLIQGSFEDEDSTNQKKPSKKKKEKKKKPVPELSVASHSIFDEALNKKSKFNFKSLFLKIIFTPVLLVLVAVLSVSLIYQLWQKQFIFWPDNKIIQTQVAPLAKPVLLKLDELDIRLPTRRNLKSLQLVSATTEPHPKRSSTLLLRISLINRAIIEQPLPWLELSLNNSEGRIISRRSLSPKDYIHNNKTNTSIGSNELKKITIELLSFPKEAAGYELRLLNKEEI